MRLTDDILLKDVIRPRLLCLYNAKAVCDFFNHIDTLENKDSHRKGKQGFYIKHRVDRYIGLADNIL